MEWLLRWWCSCLSAKEGLVFGVPRGWRRRLTGRLGQIVCVRCMPEHHGSALTFSKNWRDRHPQPNVGGKLRTQPCCLLEEWSRFTFPEFRAPPPIDPEVEEWTHGWQYHASVARDTLFAKSVHLPPLSTDHQALRESQRGPCASRHFTNLPTSQKTTFTSEEFRALSDCTCSFLWTSASANAVNLWTCLVTTDHQHVHGLVC